MFCDLAKAFDYVHHVILLNYIYMEFKKQVQTGSDTT
jgi:hypothetical protein